MRRVLNMLRADRRKGLVAAAVPAIVAGLLSAWLSPRGPVTTAAVLITMGAALLVGAMAGVLSGSRWSMLVAPLVFVAVFEAARLGVQGPTVEGIHLGSVYGLIAFLLGRGLHALLAFGPMILGAFLGVWRACRSARRDGAGGSLGAVAWTFTGLVAAGLVVLGISFALPATTHPIVGSDGSALPGSVAEITTVPLGGHDQTVMIRARSAEDPVILYLAGGPGGTDLGAMRADVSLEQDFVVATWEQRGVGKSYAALDPVSTLTVGQMVADTIELTEYLRARFGEEKIYLVGNSWGTILGVLVVERRPELFHAFIGTGQMVSPRETDTMFYEDTLAWAEATGNDALAATLNRNGPPPYESLLDYEPALSHEHDWNPYPDFDPAREMPANLFVPENSLIDRINGLRSFLDTFSVLYPQLQDLDLRRDVTRLEVPVYVVMGQYEARGRAVPAEEWFEILEAPSKEMVVFEHSGHRPLFEEPAAFASLMRRVAAR